MSWLMPREGQLEFGLRKRVPQETADYEGNWDRRGRWLRDPKQEVFEQQGQTLLRG